MQLRPDAPAFEPASPSRPKEARPASGAPEGDAERPAKRPRTSDVSTISFSKCSSFLPLSEFLTSSRCQRGMQTPAALLHRCCGNTPAAAVECSDWQLQLLHQHGSGIRQTRPASPLQASDVADGARGRDSSRDSSRRRTQAAADAGTTAGSQCFCPESDMPVVGAAPCGRLVSTAIGLPEINVSHAGFCWQSSGCIPHAMSAVALGSSAAAGHVHNGHKLSHISTAGHRHICQQ